MPQKKEPEDQRRQTVQYRVLDSEVDAFKVAAEMQAKDCTRCTGGLYLVHVRGGGQEERECKHCDGTGKLPFKYSSWARDVAVEAAQRVISPRPEVGAPKKKSRKKKKSAKKSARKKVKR